MFYDPFNFVTKARKRQPIHTRSRSKNRAQLHVEQLENRVTPSISSIFEIDGNAVDSNLADGKDDWNTALLNDAANPLQNPPAGTSHALLTTFVDDRESTDTTYFSGGGSKDGNDISSWSSGGSGAPDKNEITNAYVAAYLDAGHLVLAFGADRFTTEGSAQIGFWFFLNEVKPAASGTGFSGLHTAGTVNFATHTITTPGDFFVITDFTQGGSTPNIRVLMWVGDSNGDVDTPLFGGAGFSGDGPLQLLFNSQTSGSFNVDGVPGNDLAAAVNSSTQVSPWFYDDKDSGTADNDFNFDSSQSGGSEFFEGIIDLTAFQLGNVCLASFLAETRTSGSTDKTAVLKDFALGSFELCGSIEGTKFEDINANGVQDAGEPGLEGWTIHLSDGQTTTTDQDGNYKFKDVEPGIYTVTEVQQAGWTQTAPTPIPPGSYTFSLSLQEHKKDIDFGNFCNFDITGFKFRDNDGDGAYDANVDALWDTTQPGFVPVTIQLWKESGDAPGLDALDTKAVPDTNPTDGTGAYSFSNLTPGIYYVKEVVDSVLFTQTLPATPYYTIDSSTFTSATFTDPENPCTISGYDFGNQPNPKTFDITGRKFDDKAGDGLTLDAANNDTGGDPGLAGVTISLYFDTNNSGSFDAGDLKVNDPLNGLNPPFTFGPDTVTTGATGGYSFAVNFNTVDLDPTATYKFFVVESLPAGSTETFPSSTYYTVALHRTGDTFVTTSTPDPDPNATPTLGPDYLDFANFKNITISGHKFTDVNGDDGGGTGKDTSPDDTPLAGWTIYLDTNGDGYSPVDPLDQSTITAADGSYSFGPLGPGTYTVTEKANSLPGSWTQTFGNGGYTISAVSGTDVADRDFANFKYGSISGHKWNDVDKDPTTTQDDVLLPGWTINLYLGQTLVGSQVTNGSGYYEFSPATGFYLAGGTYTITETLQNGWIETKPPNPGTISVLVQSGTSSQNNDFFNFQPPPGSGRMTGGGSIFLTLPGQIPTPTTPAIRVTHGFELHCDTTANNRLEINWNTGGKKDNKFHLAVLTSVDCKDDPALDPGHPLAPIDTLIGTGTGTCTFNGVKYTNATISFIFTDDGEPGVNDTAYYKITLPNGTVVLDTLTGIKLTYGNHQAHKENGKVLSTAAQTIESQIAQTLSQIATATTPLTIKQQQTLVDQLLSQDAQLQAQMATITGMAWNDVNGNGIQDPGELGLAGITVQLYSATGQLVATTTTNSAGSYLFEVAGGLTYYVKFTIPLGYKTTLKGQGTNSALNSDVKATGATDPFTLAVGSLYTHLDAGFTK